VRAREPLPITGESGQPSVRFSRGPVLVVMCNRHPGWNPSSVHFHKASLLCSTSWRSQQVYERVPAAFRLHRCSSISQSLHTETVCVKAPAANHGQGTGRAAHCSIRLVRRLRCVCMVGAVMVLGQLGSSIQSDINHDRFKARDA
jgi:hypothetical protein